MEDVEDGEKAAETKSQPSETKKLPKGHVGAFVSDGPRLADLSGLGEAGEWGEVLVRDLADYRANRITWADVDRGALVSGPPGTGKTTFAVALARSCGVPLYLHSLGRWQAAGYLNDLLKAMRSAFDEARENAPAILFIDEVDAFGDRARMNDRNAQYCREVIDAFLECLDGAQGRDGVVVVGATNHPDLLDPAIRRPGRLDRHLVIPLPDLQGRLGIFRHHLRGALADLHLVDVAEATDGFSGADIERVVRDARRRARVGRRDMREGDLTAALPAGTTLSDGAFRRICVHEAGHWIAGLELAATSGQVPIRCRVSRVVRQDGGGQTEFRPIEGFDRTKQSYLALITTFLAGMAAEEVVLGNCGDGSGGSETSDLVRATEIGARLELMHGLGGRLLTLWDGGTPHTGTRIGLDPQARSRIEAVLAECLSGARAILEARRPELEAAARTLAERNVLEIGLHDRTDGS